MKKMYIWMVSAALLMGMYAHIQLHAGSKDILEADQLPESNKNVIYGNKFNGFSGLYDPVYGVDSPQVVHPPLKVEDPQYDIPKGTPFFRCYFKQGKPDFKFEVKKASISYEFVDQEFSPVHMSHARVQEKKVTFSEVFSGIDVQYTVKEDCVLEEIIVSEVKGITEIVQKIKLHGVTPVEEKKGIYFTNGEKYLFGIPPPVMYELGNPDVTCTGLHYELEFENNEYFLKKVIDEQGISWLNDPERTYPVVIDATTQSFEDVWESSGLTPYGQYFENISEYVSPSTGSLTVKQTDFFLEGRGLDVSFTRVYTTPAIFSTTCQTRCGGDPDPPEFADAPYEFECPPVNVGNGWQLNFPWVGKDYIHFLNGTMYKKQTNHTGDHFTFNNNILTTANGTEYQFDNGKILSITDVDGNSITFGYSNGKLITITDTVGRVVNLLYNSYGQLTQISYQDYTVNYSYTHNALTSVRDSLGRATYYSYNTYNNAWLMTRITYPTGGYTDYTYAYYAQEGQCYKDGGFTPYETEYRKYHVTNQAVYTPALAKNSVYSFQGDFDGITQTTVTVKNEQNSAQSYHQFDVNSKGLTTTHTVYDTTWNELVKSGYTYSARNEVLQKDVYKQGVYCYSEKYLYDSWGNVIYQEDGEGEKVYTSYANTNYENVFRDFTGDIGEFSNIFYDNSIQSTIHTALVGKARIQGDKTIETYCQYDSKGHIVDMHQVFYGTIHSSTFQNTFDESGSTSFLIDLTGVTLQGDATLKVKGVPHTNYETKTETHSKFKHCNWLNDGYWQGKYFYAEYTENTPPYQGYEPVGPFDHYPGTPGYQNYTKWVSVHYQYVKTTYNEYADKYPEQVEYNLNGNPWEVLSTHLGGSKVYHSIPAEEFISGENTLYFRESSSWTTECEWVLYVPHAVSPIEDVSTSFAYDQYGNVISTTDSENNTTILQYDTEYHAYLTTITNALNNTITATYDLSRGLLTSITDAEGNTTFYEYDILGRVTKKINPDLTELEAVYDDQNSITTLYDELDNYTKQYYDGIGRLIKQEWYLTDTYKLTQTYEYTYLNKVKTKTDPEGHVYTYEYDVLGRNTKMFNPDSSYKEIQYTDTANTVTIFDENQHKTKYQYNWVGQLLQVKEYTDSVTYYLTQYTYNSVGQMTSCTDANGNTTFYEYDSLFGATKITYPDLTTEKFLYDNVGNVIQKTDSNGTTTFEYDAVYQLTTVEYPDQSVVTFEYNANGNRTAITDLEGQTTCTYDTRNRLLSETRTIEGVPYTMSYSYDAASRLVSFTYPDQSVVTYEYDSLNRLVTIPGYAEFTYNDNSLLTTMSYSNNVVTSFQYDNRNRPVSIEAEKNDTDLVLLQYQYDPVGNISQLEYNRRRPDNQWVQSTEIFQYDWLDRLVSAQGDYGLLSYTYDPAGNRLSLNDVTYTYNDMNELVSVNDGTTYTYDDKGNTITKMTDTDTWSYTYNKNMLTQVEKNQHILTQYTYDGDCRRIKKTEWVESVQDYHTTIYVYSGLNVIYEKNVDTGKEATHAYGPTGRIAKKVGDLVDYYHTDHLTSTRLITDESGNTVTDVSYTPFGENTTTGETDSYLYTGKEKDSSGLYYYGARYYDPEIGRFITRDTINGKKEAPQTLNKYVYCLNNPLKYVDPTGNSAQDTVEEIFESLKNIDPDEYDEIQEKVDSGEMTELEAVKKILELMGYSAKFSEDGNSLKVILKGEGGGRLFTVKIDNELSNYGEYDTENCTVLINFQKSGKVTDIGLTLAHEISHATLTIYKKYRHISMPDQEKIIYGAQYSYMTAFRYLGVEYSKEYSDHVFRIRSYYNPQGEHHVPISQILRRWLPPTSPIIF